MDFSLNDEQLAIRNTCREFAEQEIKPVAARLDETGQFPYELVRKMGELGLLGLPFPEEYGGAGADFLSYCLAIEEISRGDVAIGITMEAHTSLGAMPFYLFGSQEQKERYLPVLATGEQLWAFGLTEPEAGSDSSGTRTRAVLENGRWRINGSKAFITNAGTEMSGGVTITAVTGERPDGRPEITNLIVPKGTPGYIIGNSYKKMGWKASDTRPLTFEDCEVPEENILGQRGDGFRQFMTILDGGRVAIAALSVGLAQACLDEALSYAKQRKQFGKPISSFQAIQFKLADMETEIELARLMYYKAAWLHMQGKPFRKEASMAKLFASETAKRAADQAVQIHGGYGFMEEFPVARYWRSVKINEIGEGTSEVQRMIIARQLGC
ncbi:butyryl-CoA dehydrogenase [Thermosporothrix hazakensis]|jgi:butyryl-CoA dehydrogenase|uniref:Butyryl-CoA dehydrogenase n=2 Tax=Thermosporothrix TaxID=768650 RepID=A0A326UCQ1_THEHA|nr:acyl-CoA dehydrogenase family protein [Thermosporothrix hazakensis]PZW36277.1 butyryl-CoA dehydrogenase [Thermosporothrix hazakensis]BBH88742.1 acyl-CoA dehydrogenase [Thermosporothrix sp. COM3]GCE46926.1 acyl-CoA dehydrogenase [Thermosporothrix hazakensis]